MIIILPFLVITIIFLFIFRKPCFGTTLHGFLSILLFPPVQEHMKSNRKTKLENNCQQNIILSKEQKQLEIWAPKGVQKGKGISRDCSLAPLVAPSALQCVFVHKQMQPKIKKMTRRKPKGASE